MVVFRVLGKFFIVIALALLALWIGLWLSGMDITKAGGQLWYELHVPSLQYAQVIFERHLHLDWFWQEVIQRRLLLLPAWDGLLRVFVVLMIVGGLLIYIGRDRKRPRYTFRSKP